MTQQERQAFDAMVSVLQSIDAAPRTHPDRQGATYWQYNLIPRTIERITAALRLADEVTR